MSGYTSGFALVQTYSLALRATGLRKSPRRTILSLANVLVTKCADGDLNAVVPVRSLRSLTSHSLLNSPHYRIHPHAECSRRSASLASCVREKCADGDLNPGCKHGKLT